MMRLLAQLKSLTFLAGTAGTAASLIATHWVHISPATISDAISLAPLAIGLLHAAEKVLAEAKADRAAAAKQS